MNKVITCEICGKHKSKAGKDFTKKTLAQHMKSAHNMQPEREYNNHALEIAELIADDESDGVFWGIAYEHGYFG